MSNVAQPNSYNIALAGPNDQFHVQVQADEEVKENLADQIKDLVQSVSLNDPSRARSGSWNLLRIYLFHSDSATRQLAKAYLDQLPPRN